MAEKDNSRNAFRKGARSAKIHEDPTYLSFMILFHANDHSSEAHSPLLNGEAERYLRNVVRTDLGDIYANNLATFNRVLLKVNRELPWFWQGLKGVEKAMTYGDMKEPWRGNDKPQLEIECLEENVELTAIGLMELYKNSCFDLDRYVEIVPKNLREFSMDIYFSEIRTFQKDTDARNLGITDNPDSRINSSGSDAKTVKDIHPVFNSNLVGMGADSRPFVALRFTHCEFDIDSIADYFADMSRNPEAKKPTLKIKWGTCRPLGARIGPNMFNENRDAGLVTTGQPVNDATDPSQIPLNTVSPNAQQNVSSMDSLTNVHDASDPRAQSVTERKRIGLKDLAKDTIGSIKDDIQDTAAGLVAGVTNAIDSFSLQPNGIGNVHGTQIGGFAGNLLDSAVGNLKGKLLLDNVHGAGGLGSIQDAINGGLINAVGNLIQGQLNSGGSAASAFASGGGGSGVGDRIHEFAIDSTPDGNLNANVNDPIAQKQAGPLNDNVHGGVNTGIDSTPDGNLNSNIHE
jgi:hypothetical protein